MTRARVLALCLSSTLALVGCQGAPSQPISLDFGDVDGTAHPERAQRNLSSYGLAIEGYDPVAYFPAFGGRAVEGSSDITHRHLGVTYRFVDESNRAAFAATPDAFEPAYGGWCAWAMADGEGSKVDVDPESFTIEDGRLFLFFDGLFADTRRKWRKAGGAEALAELGDGNWARISAPAVDAE